MRTILARAILPAACPPICGRSFGMTLERSAANMRRAAAFVCALVAALSVAPLVQSSPQSVNSFALQQFNQQVASYMALRQGVVDRVGVPTVSSNSTDIVQMQHALADGIRKARPRAKTGDFFSRDVGDEFRRRID